MNVQHISVKTVYNLFLKEISSIRHDKILLVLIIWAFSGAIYIATTATSTQLHKAPIAIVDEDQSPLSKQIGDAFYAPYFNKPVSITFPEVDPVLDSGSFCFVLIIPCNFQRDVTAGKQPELQINIDATRMTQSFIGNSYIQSIIQGELTNFMGSIDNGTELPFTLVPHYKYNPNLSSGWFGSIMEILSNVTFLSIILTGAAVLREREHGTLEHLLAMPVSPVEIVASKVIANGVVVLVAVVLSLFIMVRAVLGVPIHGSIALFVAGTALHLFATTSLGIFLGTLARSMPQLGLLLILTILPLQLLSGSITPRESMPDIVQHIMLASPSTHFVSFAQAILYRGAGLETVWPQFIVLAIIGLIFFITATAKFRQFVADN
ncbi:ABC transporter permease [Desulfogranum marinum]|uniref:ABC transporter permease n=1 Tax=Desulfogranum marinum TaxID=453220 RepID=UPI0019634DB1|nr:ABC transporter permease [Desulfogranum marinum]MBM9510933.1 ABC transporter permease [Desulfogranum marinum]